MLFCQIWGVAIGATPRVNLASTTDVNKFYRHCREETLTEIKHMKNLPIYDRVQKMQYNQPNSSSSSTARSGWSNRQHLAVSLKAGGLSLVFRISHT